MDPEPDSHRPEPHPSETQGTAEMAAAGSVAVAAIVTATEERVADIFGQVERSVAEIAEDSLRRDEETAARRRELARLRAELTDSAAALALRFDALLDLLEAAETELGRAPAPREDRFGAFRMTVRERRRITFAQEATAPGLPDAPAALGRDAEDRRRKRRRWWHLRGREAA